MNNFEFGMNQFAGMSGESYSANSSAFTFDYSSYPHLMDANQQLPPAPFNVFNDPFSYQQHQAPPPPPPHAPFTSGQMAGQLPGSSLFSPPSSADYPPSNGSYPWSNTPPSAPAVSSAPASASPRSLRPNPLPAAPPAQLPSQHQPATASAEDQQLEQELLEMLDEFQPAPTDNFYQPYPQMQQPGYYPQHHLAGPGSMYPHTDSIPSPYPGSGNDSNEYSPPPSFIKPPPMSFDDSEFPDLDQSELGDLDLSDLELPDGVTPGDLAVLKIPDLNKKLRDLGLSRDEQNVIKKIRRQHKNRHYAHTCRLKKVEKKSTMRSQKQILESEINDLKTDVDKLRRQRDEYKKNYEMMQQRPRDQQFS